MSAHDQGTGRSLEEWAREVERIFAPAVEYVVAAAEELQRELGPLAAALNSMAEDIEPTAAERQVAPKQYQRQAQRRMREMHSRRHQTQRR